MVRRIELASAAVEEESDMDPRRQALSEEERLAMEEFWAQQGMGRRYRSPWATMQDAPVRPAEGGDIYSRYADRAPPPQADFYSRVLGEPTPPREDIYQAYARRARLRPSSDLYSRQQENPQPYQSPNRPRR